MGLRIANARNLGLVLVTFFACHILKLSINSNYFSILLIDWLEMTGF